MLGLQPEIGTENTLEHMAKKRGNTTSGRNENGEFEPAYDWAVVVPQILDRIMSGESVHAFAGTDGLPCKRAILYECLKPEWVEQYQIAMEVRAELDGIEIDDAINHVATGEYTPQQGRVIIEGLHRRMAHRAPRKYNERVQIVNHTVEVSIKDILKRGEARLRAELIPAIEVEAKPVPDRLED